MAYNFKGSFNVLKDLTASKTDVDNIQIDGNSIISTDTNGALNLTPNGTGDLVLDGLKWPQADGTATYFLQTDGAGQLSWAIPAGAGDVVGPGSSTDNAIARYDLTTGKIIQNSGVIIDDSNNVTGAASVSLTGITLDGIGAGYANSEQVFKQAGVQTTNTTPTQIAAITLATNTMVTVEARFNGFISDYSASCGGFLQYTARRVAGGALEVSSPIVNVQEDSSGAPTIDADVSGNDVRLLVTGVGAETWNWTVSYNYHFTQTNA